MKWLKAIGKVILIAGLIGYILVLVVLFVAMTHYTQWMPTDGVWYCKELQIQIPFENSEECFAIIDDKKVTCTWGNNRGSKVISVLCQETNMDGIALGEAVFVGEYVYLDENCLILRERSTGIEYTFEKIR